MRSLGIRPNKGYGQNFLFERGLVQRMVRQAGVGPGDTVVEIGPGLGILTDELLRKAGKVVSIELDRTLWPHLRQVFGDDPRFTLVEGDALTVDLADLIAPGESWMVVANLPYSAGTAIVRRMLELPHPPRRLAVMLQLEVAERMIASPPDMSVLGVATQFYAEGGIAFRVAPEVFIPPPNVESAVAILDLRPEPPLPPDQRDRFFRIVNAGFRQKRKQVANSLAAALDLPKEMVSEWLQRAGIDPMRRAQTLTVAEWCELTRTAPAGIAE
jgi:16S rRNA (adenine1518-N6/adenine1519-N6)-dimethyltransferase